MVVDLILFNYCFTNITIHDYFYLFSFSGDLKLLENQDHQSHFSKINF